jgi:hypothetical protein
VTAVKLDRFLLALSLANVGVLLLILAYTVIHAWLPGR